MRLDPSPPGVMLVLFRWKWPCLGVFAFVTICAVAYLAFAERKYSSQVELVVRFGNHSIPDVDHAERNEISTSERQELVASNAEILQSPDLAQATIEAVGLDAIYPDIATDPPVAWTAMQEGVRRFGKDLALDVGLRSNVITVKLQHRDPRMAQVITQRLISLYIQRQTSIYENPELGFLRTALDHVHGRLATVTQELDAFKGNWRLTDIDQEVVALLKQRSDVHTNLAAAEAAAQQSERRQGELAALLPTIQKFPLTPAGDRYRALDDAQARLSDLQSKAAQLRAAAGADGNTQLSQSRAAIADAERQVQARRDDVTAHAPVDPGNVYQSLQTDHLRARADAVSSAAAVSVWKDTLTIIANRLTELQDARGTYDELVRAVSIEEAAYRSLSGRVQDAQVKDSLNGQHISPAMVISAPTLPYRPSKPRVLLTLFASVIGGMILAIGSVFLMEALDDRFTTGEQVARRLGLPLLGTLTALPALRKAGKAG